MQDELHEPPQLRTFGQRMEWARNQRRLTQGQVAKFLGYERHARISHWENGRNFPQLEMLVMVAGLYRVSIDWLIWGEGLANSLDARVKRIPKILRESLLIRLHEEIAETERAAKRLPPELAAEPIADSDQRLRDWSSKNLRGGKSTQSA